MSFLFCFFPVFVFFCLFFSIILFFRFIPWFLFVCLFVFLISFFYHFLVVISKPLNNTFTLTSCKFCLSSDYYLWLINFNCLRLPWIYNSVVDSLFFFVHQHSSPSLDKNQLWVTHRHKGTFFPYQQNNGQYRTTFTFFAARCPSLRHYCYGSRLLTNVYIFVIELKNFCICLLSWFLKLECADYKVLDSTDRNINYEAGWECDDDVVRGWFRFTGAAGSRMATRSCIAGQV